MSRTYRKAIISTCRKCNKPLHKGFGYTVEFGDDFCDCKPQTWGGLAYSPQKVWGNDSYYSVGDWKKIWNRRHRSEVKQKLNEYVKAYPDEDFKETFPISRNQALWDAY